MADNVAITAGAGTNIATDDAGAGGHVQVVKLAISTDGSATYIPADATNGFRVTPSVRKTRIAVTPTVSTSAYASGDCVGSIMTFTSAALATGGAGMVSSAVITCQAANTVTPDLDLLLFEISPTGTFTDNAAPTLTDANLETARVLPTIKFRTADYISLTSNTTCAGRSSDGQPAIDFVTSGSANLFGLLVARAAFTLASVADIVVALRILQD